MLFRRLSIHQSRFLIFHGLVIGLTILACATQSDAKVWEVKKLLEYETSTIDFPSSGSFSDGKLALYVRGQRDPLTFPSDPDPTVVTFNGFYVSNGDQLDRLDTFRTEFANNQFSAFSTFGSPESLTNDVLISPGKTHTSYGDFFAGKQDIVGNGHIYYWNGEEFKSVVDWASNASNPQLTSTGLLYMDSSGVRHVDVYGDYSNTLIVPRPEGEYLPWEFFEASGNTVAFSGGNANGHAVMLASPELGWQVVANTNTLAPGTSETFIDFAEGLLSSPVAVHSDENTTRVAFIGETAKGFGAYFWEDGLITEILSPEDPRKLDQYSSVQISENHVVLNARHEFNNSLTGFYAYSFEDELLFDIITHGNATEMLGQETTGISTFFAEDHFDQDQLLVRAYKAGDGSSLYSTYYAITIPTPATGLMLSLGCLVISMRRRQQA